MQILFPLRKSPVLAFATLLAATLLLGSCATVATVGGGRATSSNGEPLFYNGMASLSKVNSDPQQLLGMDDAALKDLLGQPALVRREGDAEIWQYRGEECVLDLFLYGGMRQVEHVDLRDRGDASEKAVDACFVDIMEGAEAQS